MPKSPEVDVAMSDKNIKAFTSFSPIYRWSCHKIGDICEVRLIDLTLPKQRLLSFVAVAHIDKELNVINSYTGWIFSEDKLQKKLISHLTHDNGYGQELLSIAFLFPFFYRFQHGNR